MTGRSLEALLVGEARRRPEIAAMLEIIEHLSDNDIDTAVVPLPWYRTALKQLRNKKLAQQQAATFNASVDSAESLVTKGTMADMSGRQVIYQGSEGWFSKEANGAGVSVMIPHGAHLFITDHGTFWYNCTAFRHLDPRLQSSREVCASTLRQYKHDYNERMLKFHADAPVIASEQPATPMGGAASLGFTFIRY